MAGYDLGGLYSSVNLDDSQFKAAIERTIGNTKDLKTSLNDLARVIIDLRTQLGNYSRDAGTLDTILQRLNQSQKSLRTSAATELEEWRAKIAAEDIYLRKMTQEAAAKADYAGLSSRYHEQEAQQRRDTYAGLELEGQYRARAAAAAAASDQNYSNLVKQLRQEEVEAAQRANAAIEADAIRRQNEIQARMIGDAAAQVRIEKEKQAAILQAERDRYYEHRRLQQAASAFQQLGMGLTVAGGIGIGADVIAAKDAAQFQDAMSKSLAVIGDVSAAMRDQLAASARDAAKETGLAAKDLAEDFAILKKGGIDAASSISLLPTFAKYAVGTSVELHDATKQALTVMEAFGLKTADLPRVLNVFASANQVARGTVDQLATSLEGRSGAALKATNVSLEQATALTVAFARRGFEASAAQTALSQVVNRLTYLARTHGDVMVDLNGKMVKFHDIVYNADGSARTLTDTLLKLNSVMSGGTSLAVGNFFDDVKMGTTRGVDAVKALVAAAPEVAELTARFQEAGAAVDEAFNKRLQSPLVQLKILVRQMQDLLITLGTPLIRVLQNMLDAGKPILDWVANTVKAFSELPEPIQLFVGTLAILSPAIVTATGNMLLMASAAVRTYADIKLLAGEEGFAGLAAKVKVVESSLGAISGIGAAGLFVGLASAVTGAALAFSKLYQETAKLHSLDADFSAFVSNRIKGAKTAEDVAALEGKLKEAYDLGTLSTREYAQATSLLKAQQDSLNSSMLSSFNIGLKIKSDKKDSISQGVGESPETLRARIFSQLGLTDYQTAIKSAQDALHQGIAAGLLSQEQIDTAQAGIQKMTEDWQNFGHAVHAVQVQATNDTGTAELAAQWQNIKDQLKQAAKLRADWAKTGGIYAGAIPQALNDPSNKTQAAVEWSEKWNQTLLKVWDTIQGINKDLVKEGEVAPPGPNGEIERIETFAKNHGIKLVVQEDLNQQAEYAKKVLADIYAYQQNGGIVASQTVASAQLAMIEAQARVMHESAQEYAKSIGQDYNQLRMQVDDSVKAGNRVWQQSLREIGWGFQQVARDIAGGLLDLIPIFNKTNQANPLQSLIDSFRSGYEALSAYSDPKAALKQVVASIQSAGDAATANAIAVKYFGATSGPLLAKELRDGTLAANDVASAIDTATLSTLQYAQQSKNSVSTVTQLWQKAVKDILQLITKQLIELGFKALIDWMFKVGNSTTSLANDMVAALKKIGQWIGIIPSAAGAAANAAGTVASDIPNSAATLGGIIAGQGSGVATAAGGAASAASGVAGAAGAAGSAGAQAAGGALAAAGSIASIVTAGVSIVSGIVSGIQQAHANNLLGEIEVSTRGSLNEALNLRRDIWDQHYGLLAKFDMIFNRLGDIWNTLMGKSFDGGGSSSAPDYSAVLGSISYYTGLILSKFDNFIVPDLQAIVAGGVTAGSGGITLQFNAPVTVQANSTSELVNKLKSRRVVRGLS